MRPSRIIVGEVRQAESLDLLIALNSGLPGMCTIHANSAREAITKMCTLPCWPGRTSAAGLSSRPSPVPSTSLCTRRSSTTACAECEIAAVPGRVEGDIVEIADLFVQRDGVLRRADGYPPTSTDSSGRATT